MAVTRAQVAELYVAFFDRAPDSAGLDYWVNDSGLSIEEISESFFSQAETQAMYPDTLTDSQFVETIYNNVFNHGADVDGLTYWVNELQAGTISRADMILAVVNGAQGTDQVVLDNKTEVGLSFADAGLSDYQDSVNIMSDITVDHKTVVAAEAQIAIWSQDVSDYTMKVTKDDYMGTDGNDVIKGVIGITHTTYNGIDILNGGDGEDTLKLSLSGNFSFTAGAATVSNVENLVITNDSLLGIPTVLDLTNYDSSVESIYVGGSSSGTMVFGAGIPGTNFDNVVDNIELASSSASTTVVNYEAPAVVSPADASAVTLSTGAAQVLVTTGIEQYTIHTGSGVQALALIDPFAGSITVDGGASTLFLSNLANAVVVDASGLAGGVNDGGISLFNTAANTTFLGGAGVDVITTAGVTAEVTGNAGADVFWASAGMTTFNYANTGDTGLTIGTADILQNFLTGVDQIDFDTLAGGNGLNFNSVLAGGASYTDMLYIANLNMAAGLTYSAVSDGTDTYLFVDGDGNGAADELVVLTGITTIAASDIIA